MEQPWCGMKQRGVNQTLYSCYFLLHNLKRKLVSVVFIVCVLLCVFIVAQSEKKNVEEFFDSRLS